MTLIEIRPPRASEYSAMFHQRWLVLRQPLGRPPGSEQDRFDTDETVPRHYVIACAGPRLVGSARLRLLEPGVGSIAYVAVLPEFARQGIGTGLMQALIAIAQQQSMKTLCLRARTSAQAFYEKLGFTATTPPFLHIGIPHVDMQRHVTGPLKQ